MKDRLPSVLAPALSALASKVAGAPWWGIALVVLTAMGMTYFAVGWLATHSITGNVDSWLITVRPPSEPEPKEPEEPEAPKPRRWLRRKPPPDSS